MFTRDGPRFGPTEADFCLRFGLSENRIFGWETEEALRRSRVEHQFSGVSRKFFFGKYNTQSSMVPRTEKSVFNSTRAYYIGKKGWCASDFMLGLSTKSQ